MKKLVTTFAISILLLTTAGLFAQNSAALKADIKDLNDPKYSKETFNTVLDQYKGKVIYLDFWASWCSPCRKEMPHSQKLQETFKGQGVVFLYISVDRNGQQWLDMIKKLSLTGEHYRANSTVHQQLNAQFKVSSIPRYIMIDKEGNVVTAHANRPSNPAVIEDIKKLL